MSPYYSKAVKNLIERWEWKFTHRSHYGPCVYCGALLNLNAHGGHTNPNAMTLDHVTPQSRGGHVTVYACCHCNSAKHDLSLTEWRMVRWLRTGHALFHYELETLRAVLTIGLLQFNQYAVRSL